jgi:hypothetical protein
MVSGTPTFFAGTVQRDGTVKIARRLIGAQSARQFAVVLDELLAGAQ